MPPTEPARTPSLRVSVLLSDEELDGLIRLSRDRRATLAMTMRLALREELARSGFPLAESENAS